MEHVKTTLITTVFNEESSIESFLRSIIRQTKLPDEVVIVDAYSSDKTYKIINEFITTQKRKNKIDWKILQKKGNRSTGRNTAIGNATNQIIASSDAGCVLDQHWIERITKPFLNKEVDVVAGYYHPVGRTSFQKALAAYTSVMPDKLDVNNFLPSSRSIAFQKAAWAIVGGYPESLDFCEDLVFARNLKRKNLKFITVKDAFVLWPQKENIRDAFLQFFDYATGDGEALYIRKNVPLLFIRYIVAALLFILLLPTVPFLVFIFFLLFLAYALWAIQKNYRYIMTPDAFYILPLLQVTADMAVIVGTTLGLVKFVRRRMS